MGNSNFGINAKFLNSPYTLGKNNTGYPSKKLLSDLEKVRQEGNFNNIKNKYLIQEIINYLDKKRALKIINYNKKIQNRLDTNIENYKNFSAIYTNIELEMIPIKNKFGTFDCFKNKSEYIHIYFNNNKEEINKDKLAMDDKINIIKVIIDYQVKSFNKLFESCDFIESITFTRFYRNNITDMSYMFYKCSSLKNINFSNFNTDNVTNMSYMFYECKKLNKLDLSNFNTENVINMKDMFSYCFLLKEIKLSNFNTKNVTNMEEMFYCCEKLKYISVNNFNTNNVKYMTRMFYGCESLKDLDLSNFDINNVSSMWCMFSFCSDKIINRVKALNKNFTEDAFEQFDDYDEPTNACVSSVM